MNNRFGTKIPAQTGSTPVETYLARKAKERIDTPAEKTTAWVAFYSTVFAAMSVMTPQAALAAASSIGLV